MDSKDIRRLAVIGAGGDLGRQACAAAIARGLDVVAIDRQLERDDLVPGRIEVRRADVLHDDLAQALDGCDAVVSTLGLAFSPGNALDPPPLYTQGTERLVAAMARQKLSRIALVSAAFVVPQRTLPTWFALTVVPALHAILEQMRGMEALVMRQSDLDWTLVRPGWLLDQPARGGLLAADGELPEGAFRCRIGDAARFLVDAVADGSWSRLRPAIGAPDEARYESPLALGHDLAGIAGRLVGGKGGADG